MRRPARGFTYVWMLFAVALGGVALAGAGSAWDVRVRREKEADLLAAGDEIARALTDYYRFTPQAAKELPARLEDLLADSRSGAPKRHLRRVYRDPLTGRGEWGMVMREGRIAGVYSLAPGTPLKRDGFGPAQQGFANAGTYAAWVFAAVTAAPEAPAPAGAPGGRPAGAAAGASPTAPVAPGLTPAIAPVPESTPPGQPAGEKKP